MHKALLIIASSLGISAIGESQESARPGPQSPPPRIVLGPAEVLRYKLTYREELKMGDVAQAAASSSTQLDVQYEVESTLEDGGYGVRMLIKRVKFENPGAPSGYDAFDSLTGRSDGMFLVGPICLLVNYGVNYAVSPSGTITKIFVEQLRERLLFGLSASVKADWKLDESTASEIISEDLFYGLAIAPFVPLPNEKLAANLKWKAALDQGGNESSARELAVVGEGEGTFRIAIGAASHSAVVEMLRTMFSEIGATLEADVMSDDSGEVVLESRRCVVLKSTRTERARGASRRGSGEDATPAELTITRTRELVK